MPLIRKVCAWCRSEMGYVPGHADPRYPVTHGMCPACKREMLRDVLQNCEPDLVCH